MVLAGGYYWYSEYNKYISTDDAHIEGDNVSVSPKILGRISNLYVEEGDTVRQGQIIAELDSTDLLSQRNQASAVRTQAVASKAQSEAKLRYDEESIKVQQINLDRAKDDFVRAQQQYQGQVITQEQFEHSKRAYEAAQAQLDAARTQLDVSRAQIGSSSASVGTAQAQVGVIESQLKNTRIFAPIDGVVARRWLLPGDIAQPGQSIVTLTDNRKLWVIVYIEETKLYQIHLNQPSIFTVDAFPGVTFKGHVISIGSNTASEFSLIPPNNASGNFTKITQRVPLKVSIDGTENGGRLSKYKILSGMSVEVKIIKGR
jgi:membrane fusion protein (multidrug efflux system)